MKTKLNSLVLACLLTAGMIPSVLTQTLPSHVNKPERRTVTVTFTFRTTLGNYTTFAGEEAEGRYYIQVPADNVPSYRFANASAGMKVMVDNEKSNEQSFVFWVPVAPGTTPRVERKDASLSLTFVPASGDALRVEGREDTPPVQGSHAAGAGSTPSSTTSTASVTAPVASQTPKPPTPEELLTSFQPFNADSELLSFAEVDLAVPESPAFTVLGLTPQTVVRPSSPRQFASSLLSGVDRHGNFQSGLALDSVPYWIFAGSGITLKEYRNSYKIRLLSRTQFSFANTKGASEDDKSVRLALGLRMTLWDDGDPHSDDELMSCFAKVGLPNPPAVAPPIEPDDDAPQSEKDEFERRKIFFEEAMKAYQTARLIASARIVSNAEECRAEARKRNWNNSSWAIGLAPSWISQTGETKNFMWKGGGFWSSLAYGFGGIPKLKDNSQLLLHLRYRNNEQVPDEDNAGQFLSQDSFFFGGRWRFGNENASANLEGVFQRMRFKGKAWDNSARYSLGLERKIAENLWFALAFGGERGRDTGKNEGFVLTSFRWGFSKKRTIPQLNPAAAGTSP